MNRPQPAKPLLAVPTRQSTASIPITVLLYNGPLLCSFTVSIKGYIEMNSSVNYYLVKNCVAPTTN